MRVPSTDPDHLLDRISLDEGSAELPEKFHARGGYVGEQYAQLDNWPALSCRSTADLLSRHLCAPWLISLEIRGLACRNHETSSSSTIMLLGGPLRRYFR